MMLIKSRRAARLAIVLGCAVVGGANSWTTAQSRAPSMRDVRPVRGPTTDSPSKAGVLAPFWTFVDISGGTSVSMPDDVTESVAWGDFNGDGFDDLFFAVDGANRLFRNEAGSGTFTDISGDAGVNDARHAMGATWGDFDNDGDADLYVVNARGQADILYRNDGLGADGIIKFTDVTTTAGTTLVNSTSGVALLDFDQDARLDIYLAGADSDILYRNLGDFRFESVALDVMFPAGREGTGVVAADFDGNGWTDIFSTNRTGHPSVLLLNDGGVLFDVADLTRLDGTGVGMAALAFDVNNDLLPDIYVASEPGDGSRSVSNLFYLNQEGPNFSDIADFSQAGDRDGIATGAAAGDIDNDGWVDFFVCNGVGGTSSTLFNNLQNSTFLDSTLLIELGVELDSRGAAFSDFDRDGDLDLCVAGGVNSDTRLWRNTTTDSNPMLVQSDSSHWIEFRLFGVLGNRDGIGAKVKLSLGELTLQKEVGAGAGRGSTNGLSLHFGLGETDLIDRIEILWPGGRRQIFYNQPVDEIRSVKEIISADLDGDGIVGILDFLLLLANWGECSNCIADLTGDSAVGIDDFLILLSLFTPSTAVEEVAVFPAPTDGWTHFELAPDAVRIFVSASEGDDANDGLSAATSLRTIEAGKARLRDGFPDWLLLKRGDVFNTGLGRWGLSGRSSDEPMLITGYGPSLIRPRMIPALTGIRIFDTDPASNLAFIGLKWELDVTVPPPDRKTGILMLHQGSNFLFEDCMFRGFGDNLVFRSSGTGLRNVVVRRCQILDAFSIGGIAGRSQGFYANNVHGLIVEECVIDHNGWNAQIAGAEANIFNHNMYIQTGCSEVTIRRNVITAASSHGLQLRSGGLCEDNLVVRNPIGLFMGGGDDPVPGGVTATVRRNVVLEGNDISADFPRGFGVDLKNLASATVSDNIVANKLSVIGGHFAIGKSVGGGPEGVGVNNTIIQSNIIYNWRAPIFFNRNCTNVSVRINAIQDPLTPDRRGLMTTYTSNPAEVSFSGNVYHSVEPVSSWFQVGSTELPLMQWSSTVEPDLSASQIDYVDPARSTATYAASLGFASTHDSFMVEIRRQSRMEWRDEFGIDALLAYFREGFQVVSPP